MTEYERTQITPSVWVITEKGRDYKAPLKGCSFAFDTETQIYFDGKIVNEKKLRKLIAKLKDDEKRKRITNITWAWQCYEEVNGFFMTNDFETFLEYVSRAGLKFGHCYNATFDFAQIDYEVLAKGREKWKLHEHSKKGEAYNKRQPYTYESLHNDMGARYSYKLWFPYRSSDRHTYCHSVEIHDFMKFLTGGLKEVLEGLDVRDNEGNPVRKLEMEYQAVDTDNLTQAEIDYCCNDVKGLYFAVKQFNAEIEKQSEGESHIHGKETNVMTAGGLAKRELLRSLYPNAPKQYRLQRYQKQHPMTAKLDAFLRENHLYRGGISFVNPNYKGKLLTKQMFGRPMNRYDVNSEYPYSMASIRDLVGRPFKKSYKDYLKMENKEDYEAVYALTSVYGIVRKGMLGMWYDPFKRKYVDTINEEGLHLMFKREFDEMINWYDDLEYTIDYVIIWKRGEYAYRPFVDKYYTLKAQAKRDKNAVMQAVCKLLLNSSYGKLSERIERVLGHYELNEQTGAIHFVTDETETSESNMNVAVGSLVTAFARVYILSSIRAVCGDEKVAERFVYIDTDSIHAFANYDKADAFALGGLKLEAQCDAVKYLLPKTYIDIERVNDDRTIDFEDFEVHSKGVSVGAIIADLHKKQKGIRKGKPTLELINRKIDYGVKYAILCAMNVHGGKVLLPVEKYLAKAELRPLDVVRTNYAGTTYLMER